MTLKQRYTNAKNKIFSKTYSFLNDMQREAVFTTEGPLLVLAGAGSGKTTVLVNRIGFIVKYGNAFFGDNIPDGMMNEMYIEKLEKLAGTENPDATVLESAMATFAQNPALPYQVLAITFTNKAADEIKARLEKTLGPAANDVWAGTFHSICVRILRMYIDRIGYERSFTIYDTDDQKRLMTSIIKEFNVSDKTFTPRSVLSEISRAKEKLLTAKDYDLTLNNHDIRRKTIAKLYAEYEKKLRAANALDFDDIIMLTVRLLETDSEVLEKYRRKFRYILVDEYQDTNKAQFKLTQMLCNDEMNIMVVGDDDQSIYKFRGATIDNILGFDRCFDNTTVIKLEQNYRSSGIIVKASNCIIKNNKGRKGKTLWTGNNEGEKITLRQCDNQNSEAEYVVNTVSNLVAEGKYKFEDFAILYRMNAQSNALEQAFAKSGIPYRIIGGVRFYERKEIKDVVAYLSVIANPGDNLRLKRIINVPKRGIGETTVEELERIAEAEGKDMLWCAANAAAYPSLSRAAAKLSMFAEMMSELRQGCEMLPLGVLVEKVVEKTGYLAALALLDEAESKDRTANVKELVSNAAQYEANNPEAGLAAFLEEVALVADIDNYDKDAPAVVMMTIHSAKGLEFPVVFLPGMEEGVFPGMQTIAESDEEMEEERRLAYVAVTRAKNKLYIIHCHNRMVFGRTEFHQKSRFVEEIPEDCLEIEFQNIDTTRSRDDDSFSFGGGRTSFGTTKTGGKMPSRYDAFAYAKSHDAKIKREAAEKASAESFKVGERVKHAVFGEGMITGAKPMAGDTLYEVAFDNVGTKKIMGNYAKMSKA